MGLSGTGRGRDIPPDTRFKTTYYPFHPRRGCRVAVVRCHRFRGVTMLVVEQPDGTMALIPGWTTILAAVVIELRETSRFPPSELRMLRQIVEAGSTLPSERGNGGQHGTLQSRRAARAVLDGGAQVAKPMPVYDGPPAHGFLPMPDTKSGPAPGDPARIAARIIESVDVEPAPLRIVLGSQRLESKRPRQRFPEMPARRSISLSLETRPMTACPLRASIARAGPRQSPAERHVCPRAPAALC